MVSCSHTGICILQSSIDFICGGCSLSHWLSLDNRCDESTLFLQGYEIDDNYCGEQNFNYYIDGDTPIVAEAAVKFDSVASAITIDIVNDYTVAFIGTDKGHLLKVRSCLIAL